LIGTINLLIKLN